MGLPSTACRGSETPAGECGSNGGLENVSNTAKWVICAICAVLGVIALIYAVIYLAVRRSIRSPGSSLARWPSRALSQASLS